MAETSTSKNMLSMSFSIFISRITGFLRDIVFGAMWGTSTAMAAFTFAFKIPNLLRNIFGEGALNSAFVPIFTKKHQENEQNAFAFANSFFGYTVFLLTILTTILTILALLAKLFVDSELATLTLNLLPYFLPFLIFICLSALLSGLLNSLNSFFIPALMSSIMNGIFILTAWLICPLLGSSKEEQIYGMIFAVLASGIIQIIILAKVAKRHHFQLKLNLERKEECIDLFRRTTPAFLSAGLRQINTFVDTLLAATIGGFAVSSLYYSERLVQIPIGIFAVALGTVCLPAMSRKFNTEGVEGLKESLRKSLNFILFITIPCAVMMFTHSKELIVFFFQRGEFTELSTKQTLLAFNFAVLGIPVFSAIKVITPAFNSRLDIKTPAKTAIFCMGINLILNLILMQFLQQGGLALATVLSSTINVIILLILLKRDIGELALVRVGQRALLFIFLILLALFMGHIFSMLTAAITTHWLKLILTLAIEGVTYLGLAYALKLNELSFIHRP